MAQFRHPVYLRTNWIETRYTYIMAIFFVLFHNFENFCLFFAFVDFFVVFSLCNMPFQGNKNEKDVDIMYSWGMVLNQGRLTFHVKKKREKKLLILYINFLTVCEK